MPVATRIIDRQLGRNTQLLAEAIAEKEDPRERYPYVRILISLIEFAHNEWAQAPNKDEQIAELAWMLSGRRIDREEVALVVRVRDAERGYVR